MEKFEVSDLVSALDEDEDLNPVDFNKSSKSSSNVKVNPLKTNKQRSSNRKSKSSSGSTTTGQQQKRSPHTEVNSTDEENVILKSNNNNIPNNPSNFQQDDSHEMHPSGSQSISNFDFDSDENITERLSSLAKLSLQAEGSGSSVPPPAIPGCSGTSFNIGNPSSKKQSMYPNLIQESDSILPLDFAGQPGYSGPGGTTADCASASGGTVGDNDGDGERRCRRRRRRRGHNNNTKRMAVDTSPYPDDNGMTEGIPSEDVYPSTSRSKTVPLYKKVGSSTENKSQESLMLDSFGMKRKRNIMGCQSKFSGARSTDLNPPSPCMGIDDEEMKSDDDDDSDDYSTSPEEDDKDDRGREADDEQSDWVFDEWSNSSKKSPHQEESALSRKKRLMKMLRSYKQMISGGRDDQFLSREILAGKRRVMMSKPNFPSRSIWTSANEEVSKFLQDPMQSQIKLQPISMEERVQLSHLASLYSLQMDYCSNEETSQDNLMVSDKIEEAMAPEAEQKLYPILTKTPKTTQMDKGSSSLITNTEISSTMSSFGQQGDNSNSSNSGGILGEALQSLQNSSSFGNLERSYCPTISYSDVDSIASDTKRIKK